MADRTADIRAWVDRHLEGVTWSGDQAECRCPLHKDREPSCSVMGIELDGEVVREFPRR